MTAAQARCVCHAGSARPFHWATMNHAELRELEIAARLF
jgi:hypothetical protein